MAILTPPRKTDSPEPDASEKVPWRQKLAYSLGYGPVTIADKGLVEIGLPVFNIIFGISPGLVSLVLGISRVWDAFTDPMVGNISDNLRTRWGRRRPLIFGGSIFAGLALVALYQMPTGMAEPWPFLYYLTLTLVFYTALSFHMVPYEALGYTLSADRLERSRVFVWRAFAAKLFLITVAWGYAFLQSDLFASDVQGARVTGFIMGMSVIVFGLLPAIFVPERGYGKIRSQTKVKFRAAVRGLIGSRGAMNLLGCFVFLKAPSVLIGGIDFYALAYYVCDGDLAQAGVIFGLKNTTQMVASMVALLLLPSLLKRFEKKTTLYWGIFFGLLATALKYPCFTPEMPYLAILPYVFIGPTLSAVWALLPSMMADVVDEDELECGSRREGTFSACWQWAMKASAALGMALSGFMLQATGFDESLGGAQSEGTIAGIRVLIVLTPLLFYAGALYFTRRYPLDAKKMEEVEATLERRRGKL